MSDRLAVSASLSVLMMSIYVLFGTEASHAGLKPEYLPTPPVLAAPVSLGYPGRLNPFQQ